MEKTKLSEIEREIVLKYLTDGNAPITVALSEKLASEEAEDEPIPVIFSIDIHKKDVVVSDSGVIILKHPHENVQEFDGKVVKVEFYFNKIGLFFLTELKEVSGGLALVIPHTIYKLTGSNSGADDYSFSAVLSAPAENGAGFSLDCVPENGYEIFSRPVWSSIAVKFQNAANRYLENLVAKAKSERGNCTGIHFIPICRYMVESNVFGFEPKPYGNSVGVIFINHKRIVFALCAKKLPLAEGVVYDIKMSFRLKAIPLVPRNIFAKCAIEKIYEREFFLDANGTNKIKKIVMDCVFFGIKEEDLRFLYEHSTKKLIL